MMLLMRDFTDDRILLFETVQAADRFFVKFLLLETRAILSCIAGLRIVNVKVFYLHVDVDFMRF